MRLRSSSCHPVATLAATVVLSMIAACGHGPSTNRGVTMRDSSGVTIVESAAALEAQSLDWGVAAQPDLRIGVAEGEEPYQLLHVDGAMQLPNGTIAVLNAGTQEIRYFDTEGRYLRTSGRRGSGPGEFQMPRLVRPLGERGEQLIWDMMVNRFTLLDANAGVLRMITPEARVRMPQGWDAAGAVLVARGGAAAGLDTPEGVMANDFTYEAVHLDGGQPVRIAELPARTYHAQIRGQPWFRPIPFDPQPSAAAGRGAFYLSTGAMPSIQVHASDGQLLRVLRVARNPDPVLRADFDRFVEAQLQRISDEELRTEWRTRYERMPLPATMPAYRSLLVDDVDHVWAEHFRIDISDPPTWSVFEPDGGVLGTIRTLAGISIFHIGEDFFIGRMRDDLGVEQVVRYPLDRTAGAS